MMWRKYLLLTLSTVSFCLTGFGGVRHPAVAPSCPVNIIDPPEPMDTECPTEKKQYVGFEEEDSPFRNKDVASEFSGGVFYEKGHEMVLGTESPYLKTENEIVEEEKDSQPSK